ncbi:MAG: hypothetical protein ILA13_05125 [Eubacterium sp.]|nr:hypothetical protein [Eubacterium sp.]
MKKKILIIVAIVMCILISGTVYTVYTNARNEKKVELSTQNHKIKAHKAETTENNTTEEVTEEKNTQQNKKKENKTTEKNSNNTTPSLPSSVVKAQAEAKNNKSTGETSETDQNETQSTSESQSEEDTTQPWTESKTEQQQTEATTQTVTAATTEVPTEAPTEVTTEVPKVECSQSPNGKHNWQDWYEPKDYYVGVKCHCQHCGYEWIADKMPQGYIHICDDGSLSNYITWDEYETKMEYAYTYCTYCNQHK